MKSQPDGDKPAARAKEQLNHPPAASEERLARALKRNLQRRRQAAKPQKTDE